MKKFFYILLLLPLLLASCVTSRRVNYMQEPDKKIPAYADTISFSNYELRIGDRLYIHVYSLDEKISQMYNSGRNSSMLRQQMNNGNSAFGSYDLYTYLVDEEGNIEFPTIGKLHVLGLTVRDVKFLLEEQLATLLREMPGYSTISVEVQVVQRSFSVIGMQSGRYPITKEKLTIFEALALAGDIGTYGDKAQIKLVREINGETIIKTFDVRSKDIINSEFYYIEPNDIIYIRRFNGYSFGMSNVGSVISVTAATLSFGVFIYTIVQTGIKHVNKYYPKNPNNGEGGNK